MRKPARSHTPISRTTRVPVVVLALLLSACATSPPPGFAAPALRPGEALFTGFAAVTNPWSEPPNYSFDFGGGFVFASLAGTTRVVVRDHQVVQPRLSSGAISSKYQTISQIISSAAEAAGHGSFVALVRAADGRPTFVYIDDPRFIDEEYRATMTNYVPE